jgi:hypothetical protein
LKHVFKEAFLYENKEMTYLEAYCAW